VDRRVPGAATYVFVGEYPKRLEQGYRKMTLEHKSSYKIGQYCGHFVVVCYRVEVDETGTIYAGETRGDEERTGVGATFSSSGTLLQQGYWENGVIRDAYE
jgi:hypothetical protein